MSTAADLQNLTRRFWRGQVPSQSEVLEIVSMDEIQEMSGFTLNSLRTYAGRNDFPSHVARVKRKLFWRKDDIEHWIACRKA